MLTRGIVGAFRLFGALWGFFFFFVKILFKILTAKSIFYPKKRSQKNRDS
jgi:hypothetical protein